MNFRISCNTCLFNISDTGIVERRFLLGYPKTYHTRPELFRVTREWISRARSVPKLLYICSEASYMPKARLEIIQELFAKHIFQKLWVRSCYMDEIEPLWATHGHLLEHVKDLYVDDASTSGSYCKFFFPNTKLLNLQRLFIKGKWDIKHMETVFLGP